MSPSSRLGVALGGLGTRAGPSRGLQLLGVGDRAPGGALALVEALGVGAALRGVELQVGAAPPRGPSLRRVQQRLADPLTAAIGMDRQVLDPAARAEANRVRVEVGAAETDQLVVVGDQQD